MNLTKFSSANSNSIVASSVQDKHNLTNKENITIRRAERKDCKRLLELVRELATYVKAPNDVTVSLEHFEESGFGEKPVWWGFVAEIPSIIEKEQGEIIGFALYYIRYSTWKGQRIYLEDLIVTEAYRSKGIGKLLFDRLIVEAKEKNFTGIAWQALKWNTPAINFYKKYNTSFDEESVNCSMEIK